MVMKKALLMCCVVLLCAITAQAQTNAQMSRISPHGALVNEYCVVCHDEGTKTAGLSLEDIDTANPSKDTERWEKVILKMKAGMMPPPEMPKPEAAAIQSFIT